MKIEHHIAVSALISGILYAIFKSMGLSIASFIAGVLIDVDHIIDYILAHGLHFDAGEFMDYFYKEKHQKITLILHGWELLIILLAAAILSGFNPIIAGTLVGYGHHIVSDVIYSKAPFCSYSIICRWKKGFDSNVIFPRDRGYNPKT